MRGLRRPLPQCLAIALAASCAAFAAAGCQGDARTGKSHVDAGGRPIEEGDPLPGAAPAEGPSPASGTGSATGQPAGLDREHQERFFRVDSLITAWDAAQIDGDADRADSLANQVSQETDADYATFAAAARGDYGLRAQHLGVKALGFSRNPQATPVLAACLQSNDPQLLGNALIALKIRSDPATPVPPLVALLRSPVEEARRYAPLALANVVLARDRAGRPLEATLARDAMTGLVGLVQDRDPYVRLHTAKAMGALRMPEGNDFLVMLLKDEHPKIRLAAAAALERIGDPRPFPQVVALLEQVDADQKPVVRDLLVSYAERIQGAPLTDQQKTSFGTSAIAWDRWYAERKKPAPR